MRVQFEVSTPLDNGIFTKKYEKYCNSSVDFEQVLSEQFSNLEGITDFKMKIVSEKFSSDCGAGSFLGELLKPFSEITREKVLKDVNNKKTNFISHNSGILKIISVFEKVVSSYGYTPKVGNTTINDKLKFIDKPGHTVIIGSDSVHDKTIINGKAIQGPYERKDADLVGVDF